MPQPQRFGRRLVQHRSVPLRRGLWIRRVQLCCVCVRLFQGQRRPIFLLSVPGEQHLISSRDGMLLQRWLWLERVILCCVRGWAL